MVGVLMILFYSFAVFGTELLHDALDPKMSATLGTDCSPLCPSFATTPLAWLTLFQLLISASWSGLLIEAIARTESLLPALFFFSYVILCHVLMLSSLLVALMLEVYSCEMEKAERARYAR